MKLKFHPVETFFPPVENLEESKKPQKTSPNEK